MIIGISGKSGSGKTTLANQISTIIKKESVHLDIDKVGHKVLTKKEVFEELKKSFGEELPITKYFDQCDIKILLDIPYEIRKKRAMQRDNISEKAFDLRDNSSIDLNPAEFDYVLREINNEDIKRMVKKI